jgi:AcrR family transcriptional regulator
MNAAEAVRGQVRRPLRADARRNEEVILEAAKGVFVKSGVDAPIREIAAAAGVGLGTLYRRFPSRSDLVAAVFRREVDVCAAEAVGFAKTHGPGEALSLWLYRYTEFIATKRGLAAALRSGDPAFEALPSYFQSNFEPALGALLEAAVSAGEISSGTDPYDLLRAIGNLAVGSGVGPVGHTKRMVGLLIKGLRCQVG